MSLVYEQKLNGDAAIGRIPVVSADGTPLMPCKPIKAWRLLESGKAVVDWSEDGEFYIKLKFKPQSLIMHPQINKEKQRTFLKPSSTELDDNQVRRDDYSTIEDMNIWKLIPPKRGYLAKFLEIIHDRKYCMEVLNWKEKMYLHVLFKAKWNELRSPKILTILAPIIKKLLKAFVKKPKPAKNNDFPKLEDLERARRVGMRNGRLYYLKKRGEMNKIALLDASIIYLKRGYRITNPKLKEALESIVEMLEPATDLISKSRILKKGREKAANLLNNLRKFTSLASQISNWIKSEAYICLLYTSPSPRDLSTSRMPSSA